MRSTLTLSKPASRAASNASPRLGGRVQPVEPRQDAVVQALHAEADPGHPRAPVAGEARPRVTLSGLHSTVTSAPGSSRKRARMRSSTAAICVGVEQRRGAAAEEDACRGSTRARPRRRARQVASRRSSGGRKRSTAARGIGRGVEGAVAAPLRAEGQVHVDARAAAARGAQPSSGADVAGEGPTASRCPAVCQRSQWPLPVPRPVDQEGLAADLLAPDEAPVAAVLGVVPVVAHDEVRARRHHERVAAVERSRSGPTARPGRSRAARRARRWAGR